MNASKPSLQLRAFTSVLIATAFLALLVSGTIMFLSPPGRVANWSDGRMLGLTKHEWTGLEAKGIKLAPGRTLRDIALDNGYARPYEILDIIEGKTK